MKFQIGWISCMLLLMLESQVSSVSCTVQEVRFLKGNLSLQTSKFDGSKCKETANRFAWTFVLHLSLLGSPLVRHWNVLRWRLDSCFCIINYPCSLFWKEQVEYLRGFYLLIVFGSIFVVHSCNWLVLCVTFFNISLGELHSSSCWKCLLRQCCEFVLVQWWPVKQRLLQYKAQRCLPS